MFTTAVISDQRDAITLGSVATYAASLPTDQLKADTKESLVRWYLRHRRASYQDLVDKRDALRLEENAIVTRGTIALIMQENDSPAIAKILDRGEYDLKLDEVPADVPEQLPGWAICLATGWGWPSGCSATTTR